MRLPESGRLSRDGLLQYFLDAAKPRERWLVGMEVERIGRDAMTGAPLPYTGKPNSILKAIEGYRDLRGGKDVLDGSQVIGLVDDWGNISIEPGGQFEWSSRPCTTLEELQSALAEHQDAMHKLADRLGIRWLDEAVDPDLPVDAMEWMPKSRYKIMRPFLGARGRLAHRMMTQSAAIQVAFDYADPADWKNKFRAAAYLAPIATALFANSSRIDGEPSGYRSFRQAIWRETDPERCGLPPVVFDADFSLERWLDWVLQVPTIFRHRGSGRIAAGGTRFTDLLELSGCDAIRMSDWETHVSTIFTEVRSYTYIEVRSADLQPEATVFAVPVFWAGLLYQQDALDAALKLGSVFADYDTWSKAMVAASRDGLDASVAGHSIGDLCRDALTLSRQGLRQGAACVENPAELLPILDALEKRPITPR